MNRHLSKLVHHLLPLTALSLIASFPITALAQVTPFADCGILKINCGGADPKTTLINFIWSAINIALAFTAVLATGALVYFGVMYILSRGDQENTRKAKTGLIYAIIGIFIIGLAGWLVNAVLNIYLS